MKTLTKNLATLLEQLELVFAESGVGPTMNAHEFINYVLDFDPNNLYITIEEIIINILDEKI